MYCDDSNINESSYIVFEIVFGPGKMGIILKSKRRQLFEGEEPVDCVYIMNNDSDDMTISGPGKRVKLFQREPVILFVNREPTDCC